MINHLKSYLEGKLAENRTFEPESVLRNSINPLYKEIKGITLQCAERESQIDVTGADAAVQDYYLRRKDEIEETMEKDIKVVAVNDGVKM